MKGIKMNLLEQREEYLKQRGIAITELREEYMNIIKDGIWKNIAKVQRELFLRDIVEKGGASPLGLKLERGCRIEWYESLLKMCKGRFNLISETYENKNEVPSFLIDNGCLRSVSTVDYNVRLINELIGLYPELSQCPEDPTILVLKGVYVTTRYMPFPLHDDDL